MADEVEAQLASITGDLLEDSEPEKNLNQNADLLQSDKSAADPKDNENAQNEVEQTIEEMLTEGLSDEKKEDRPVEKMVEDVEEKMEEDVPGENEPEPEKAVEESEDKEKEKECEEKEEEVVEDEKVEEVIQDEKDEKEKSEEVHKEKMLVEENKKEEENKKKEEETKKKEEEMKKKEEEKKKKEDEKRKKDMEKKDVPVPKPEITADAINVSIKEIVTQDVLVCGKCHQVYHFVEAFQDHKANANCKENGELKETLTEDKKPQIWAFTLWKNTKFKDNKEETDKQPTSSIYQTWSDLDEKEKEVWTKAGESIQSLCEIVHQFDTIKLAKIKERKARGNEKDSDCGNMVKASKEKDPLGIDSESGAESSDVGTKKAILKPVQLNNKVTIISRKPKNTRKAVRTGSDPKIEHLVEKIMSKRYNPRKKTFEYLIKWENFDSEKNTWEPLANLYNCKTMMEEFEKNLQIQKEQQRIEKMIAKKQQKKQELLRLQAQGRPQRTSKQKALNQVKQWCGNMEADENSGKRYFSDDSDEDESFDKRMKYDDYSSDSEAESTVIPLKRVNKSQNGVEKKPKVESITLPENILIPDAKGIVRINQKQIPSLSSGVYVMSKTAGIIKLDTKASKMATSGGQTVLRVAPKIGQTSIKIIKKEISNGASPAASSTPNKGANILRAKPPLQKYNSRIYVQKRTNAQNAKKVEPVTPKVEPEKEDDESDGIEELEFPTDIPIPTPDSPPPEFTLCPLTGKVLGKDGKAIEEPEPEKSDELPSTSESGTAVLDNLVNLAAADILDDLQPKAVMVKKEDEESVTPMETDCQVPIKKEQIEEPSSTIDLPTPTKTIVRMQPKQTDSILSTALTNANIGIRRTPLVHRSVQKTVINRTLSGGRSAPQAIITRITPGTSPIHRSRVMAPKPKEATIIRKRTLISSPGGASSGGGVNRSVVRRVAEKVYTSAAASGGSNASTTVQSTSQSVNSYVATPTSANIVINMPSLIDGDTTTPTTTTTTEKTNASIEGKSVSTSKTESQEELQAVPTTSTQSANSLSIPESETPLLITGEDGTIYQVAGQNEEGQTILITQGEDGEQHCLFVAPENAGLFSQALMKPEPAAEPEPEQVQEVQAPAAVTESITVNTETEEAADDSQVVAQIVSANPPSPGGTRKVVLMLPDGNFMMTEVTAEQYQALELDK